MKGWGIKSSANLFKAISSRRKIPLQKFLFGLGIRGLGKETSKSLATLFGSFYIFWNDLKNAASEGNDDILIGLVDQLKMAKVSQKAIDSLVTLVKSKSGVTMMEDLLLEVTVLDTDTTIAFSDSNISGVKNSDINKISELNGKSVVFTGTLKKFTRKQAEDICRNLGGIPEATVKASTGFVVVGETDNKSTSKMEKAAKYGIKVLTESDWLSMTRIV